jgi:citrate lyase beta subunit
MSLREGLASTIIVPKVEDLTPLQLLQEAAASANASLGSGRGQRWNLVASIESAKAVCAVEKIAGFRGSDAASLVALLVSSHLHLCASSRSDMTPVRFRGLYATKLQPFYPEC